MSTANFTVIIRSKGSTTNGLNFKQLVALAPINFCNIFKLKVVYLYIYQQLQKLKLMPPNANQTLIVVKELF